MSDSEDADGSQSRPVSSYQKRKAERRSGHDQRDMIRFDIEKNDRRSGEDRRSSAISWGSDDPV